MTHTPDDDDIRARFRALRDDTRSEGVPEFRAMLDRARAEAGAQAEAIPLPARRRWLRVGGWAGVAAAAALAGVLITRDRPDPADAEFERLVASFATDGSAGMWRSPTAALLDVPGGDLMSSVPSVGAAMPGIQIPELPDFERAGDSL